MSEMTQLSSDASSQLGLEGKVVVVTGAARGIGEAIARAFGSNKCSVLVADRMKRPDGQQRAQATVDAIVKRGSRAVAMKVDVSDRSQVEKMFQTAVDKFGRVDIFVNNAAIMKGGSLVDMNDVNLQEHFDVNVKGCFYCCQLAAKQMIKQGSGEKIVIISSVDGLEAEEGIVAYSASKAALVLMMKCMAVELARHKINVNAIAPGWVETDMSIPYLNEAHDEGAGKEDPSRLRGQTRTDCRRGTLLSLATFRLRHGIRTSSGRSPDVEHHHKVRRRFGTIHLI